MKKFPVRFERIGLVLLLVAVILALAGIFSSGAEAAPSECPGKYKGAPEEVCAFAAGHINVNYWIHYSAPDPVTGQVAGFINGTPDSGPDSKGEKCYEENILADAASRAFAFVGSPYFIGTDDRGRQYFQIDFVVEGPAEPYQPLWCGPGSSG